MEETTTREKVLKKIRNSLISKVDNPFPSLDMESSVYEDFSEQRDIVFAEEFTKMGGKFIYCESHEELKRNLQSLSREKGFKEIFCRDPEIIEILNSIGIPNFKEEEKLLGLDAGITQCELLVARFGSILISSKQISGRRLNVYPETHIVIARSDQIVFELKEAINHMKEKYGKHLPSMMTFITGPSRTADIEKTLVMGAHGPKELYLLLIDSGS
ncbi:MAG: lactate utilization protein [Bacteroidales bacterium]|nr:lactate utilization protein [Bacteroidales bacterium]MCF8403631.1 lactate utilization protein [Bacteroidales bacterium]